MQEKLEEEFFKSFVFIDKATYQTNGKVNRQNVCIWSEKNLHATIARGRDSPKLDVFCAISKNNIHDSFFFEGGNVTGEGLSADASELGL